MFHTALTASVPWREIGNMTIEDVALAAQVKQEKDEKFVQTLAWIAYQNAALIGIAVNNPKKFPKIEDAFPSLFEKKEQQDWRVMKERMAAFAKAKNEKSHSP